jgi:YgiT-type zinc finger domain-containing protein
MRDNCECSKQKKAKVSKVIRIGSQSVQVENAPARVCPDCGEIYFDGRFILNLEKKLERLEKQAA